jgi:hypothetical protein
MQVLTTQVKVARPGTIIYGIGDDAHKKRISGHNEDDTAGSKARDQDADNIPEHRAIDVMPGASFSKTDGDLLTKDLTENIENRKRLIFVNWGNSQYHRDNNWEARDNSDDPHAHVHAEGEADADDNTSPWVLINLAGTSAGGAPARLTVDGELGPKTIARWQQIMGTPVDGKIDPTRSSLVMAVQRKLRAVAPNLQIDGQGIYQNNKRYKTAAALQSYLQSPVDGVISAPVSQVIKSLQRKLNTGKF